MIIVMLSQFINLGIGLINLGDVLNGKESRQSVLPEQMLTFHFSLGLWSGCVLEGDPKPLRIPDQFGHSFRFNSATCSDSIRPGIPVNSATPLREVAALGNRGHDGLQKGVDYGPREVIHAEDIGSASAEPGAEVVVS